jgi:hypothetical protein
MALDSKHPSYTKALPDWNLMADVHEGERKIKDQGQLYLPVTSGQKADGMNKGQPGKAAYDAYRERAVFPNSVKDAVEAMLGVMHHKPPVIELPKPMEPMLESVTLFGESLEMLLQRINEQQLITGRMGLLLDVADQSPVGTLPYIATYQAATILNWDDGKVGMPLRQILNLVILDESEHERIANFEWEFKKKYRALILGDPTLNEAAGVYATGMFDENSANFNALDLVIPSIGGKTLDEIPFVFINAKDIIPEPDAPPLLGLGRLALTIYRGEADYRQALFMQGQDTLVVIGALGATGGEGAVPGETTFRTGANASIELPSGPGNDAKYIGVNSEGLTEMREALENDYRQASEKGGQLIDSVSREKESGDALKIRVAARTATLNQIVLAGAFGLEQVLKMAARWLGQDDSKVKVTPNLDFADDSLDGKTLNEWMTAKALGAPLSLRTIHDRMHERELTDMDFEEELAEIEKEKELDLTFIEGAKDADFNRSQDAADLAAERDDE